MDTPATEGEPYTALANPEAVTIRGYTGSAMEPFMTRDGAFLLFNNSHAPAVDTNIQVARRVDDLTFDYVGVLAGADSKALDGVPTLDRDGNLYFVSTRDYESSLSTIYRGHFNGLALSDVTLVPDVSRRQLLVVNFDVEVSADGSSLYFVDAGFSRDGVPQHADLVIADREGDGFVRRADSAAIMANVSSSALEYAAAISRDQLELFFTRVGAITPDAKPTIYRAVRASIDEPFGTPSHVEGAEGFVEGPTLSPDETALYYHRCDAGICSIFRITRRPVLRPILFVGART